MPKADIRIAADLLFDHPVEEHLAMLLVLVAELTVDAGQRSNGER